MENKIRNRDQITKRKKYPTTEKKTPMRSSVQEMLLNGPHCFDRSLLTLKVKITFLRKVGLFFKSLHYVTFS